MQQAKSNWHAEPLLRIAKTGLTWPDKRIPLGLACPGRFHGRMFQYIALARDKQWQPGPYPGVELMVLHKHEATGGVAVLRKFHAGVTVPAHVHPLANEQVYVLQGEWEESGVVYGPGSYFFAPKGERHGPHVARTEVLSFTVFDGPLTVA